MLENGHRLVLLNPYYQTLPIRDHYESIESLDGLQENNSRDAAALKKEIMNRENINTSYVQRRIDSLPASFQKVVPITK